MEVRVLSPALISFVLGFGLDSAQVLNDILCTASPLSGTIRSVGLNFFQEYSANQAAEKLKAKVATRAIVIRDGKNIEILTSKIVPGDVLVLNAGDLVPADARLIESKDLYSNQSALTGESFPVEKVSEKIQSSPNDINSLSNFVFAGTSIVTGTALAVVVKTGLLTQFGTIAKNLSQEKDENEFTKGINDFSVLILRIIIIFVVFIFLANTFIKHDIIDFYFNF